MKPSKSPCQHKCHEQCPEPQDNHVPRLAQLEPANAGYQHVSRNQVEHSPQDVDHRRRQTLSGRRCERALERATRNAVHQVWDRVCEESPTEEVSDKVIPAGYCLRKTPNSVVISHIKVTRCFLMLGVR